MIQALYERAAELRTWSSRARYHISHDIRINQPGRNPPALSGIMETSLHISSLVRVLTIFGNDNQSMVNYLDSVRKGSDLSTILEGTTLLCSGGHRDPP